MLEVLFEDPIVIDNQQRAERAEVYGFARQRFRQNVGINAVQTGRVADDDPSDVVITLLCQTPFSDRTVASKDPPFPDRKNAAFATTTDSRQTTMGASACFQENSTSCSIGSELNAWAFSVVTLIAFFLCSTSRNG